MGGSASRWLTATLGLSVLVGAVAVLVVSSRRLADTSTVPQGDAKATSAAAEQPSARLSAAPRAAGSESLKPASEVVGQPAANFAAERWADAWRATEPALASVRERLGSQAAATAAAWLVTLRSMLDSSVEVPPLVIAGQRDATALVETLQSLGRPALLLVVAALSAFEARAGEAATEALVGWPAEDDETLGALFRAANRGPRAVLVRAGIAGALARREQASEVGLGVAIAACADPDPRVQRAGLRGIRAHHVRSEVALNAARGLLDADRTWLRAEAAITVLRGAPADLRAEDALLALVSSSKSAAEAMDLVRTERSAPDRVRGAIVKALRDETPIPHFEHSEEPEAVCWVAVRTLVALPATASAQIVTEVEMLQGEANLAQRVAVALLEPSRSSRADAIGLVFERELLGAAHVLSESIRPGGPDDEALAARLVAVVDTPVLGIAAAVALVHLGEVGHAAGRAFLRGGSTPYGRLQILSALRRSGTDASSWTQDVENMASSDPSPAIRKEAGEVVTVIRSR